MLLAFVMVVAGLVMHRKLVFDGYAMRRLKINGEIAHIYEGMRRDAASLASIGLVMLLVAGYQARQDRLAIHGSETMAQAQEAARRTISMDDILIVFVSAAGAWVGIQRIRDKRFGEMLAAARVRLDRERTRQPGQV
jgi:hypothetical protein